MVPFRGNKIEFVQSIFEEFFDDKSVQLKKCNLKWILRPIKFFFKKKIVFSEMFFDAWFAIFSNFKFQDFFA